MPAEKNKPLPQKDRRDGFVSYRALLMIVVPIGVLMTTIIIFFFNVTANELSKHMRDSLAQQLSQLRLIVDTHADTPHRGVATEGQILAMETRFQRQMEKNMVGVLENSEAVRQIAELVLSSDQEVNGNKLEIERLRDFVEKISNKVGM